MLDVLPHPEKGVTTLIRKLGNYNLPIHTTPYPSTTVKGTSTAFHYYIFYYKLKITPAGQKSRSKN